MLIPGPKLNKVFASRWHALWWAAVVLLTAYCSIPDPEPGDATATPSATGP